jgi:hypothetical protein
MRMVYSAAFAVTVAALLSWTCRQTPPTEVVCNDCPPPPPGKCGKPGWYPCGECRTCGRRQCRANGTWGPCMVEMIVRPCGCDNAGREFCKDDGTCGCTVGPCPPVGEVVSVADIDDVTCSLRQFETVQCGGPTGTCPKSSDSAHGQYSTNETASPLGLCSTPDSNGGCRFQCVTPPNETSSNALQVIAYANGDNQGDWDPGFRGPRNELLGVREKGAMKEYTDGDNRYYRWRIYLPPTFPDPPRNTACTNGNFGPNAFQLLLQFHDDAEGASHVPLSFGVNRTNECGENSGNQYRFRLVGDADYGDKTADPVDPELVCPAAGQAGYHASCVPLRIWADSSPITKNQWYDIVLHVRWGTSACSNGCDWNNPNGGAVELWINGDHKVSAARPTIARWPATSPFPEDNDQYPHNANQVMLNHLKIGIYLDELMLNFTSSIVIDSLRVGTTCASIWPGGCPR